MEKFLNSPNFSNAVGWKHPTDIKWQFLHRQVEIPECRVLANPIPSSQEIIENKIIVDMKLDPLSQSEIYGPKHDHPRLYK